MKQTATVLRRVFTIEVYCIVNTNSTMKVVAAMNRRRFVGSLVPLGLVASGRAYAGNVLEFEPPQQESDPGVPSASPWMERWMQTPQHGEQVTKGPGGVLVLSRFADPMYFLMKPISWTPDNDQTGYPTFTVPTGFVTDLASIPAVFWSLLRPDGDYAYAAILHDYLYWVQKWPKSIADGVLKRAMEDFHVPTWKVDAIFGAVAVFGQGAWDENAKLKSKGESRFIKNFPTDPTVRWSTWRSNPANLAPGPI